MIPLLVLSSQLLVLSSQMAAVVDPATYVGNVYGTAAPNTLISVGDRVGRADANGRFLINSIPTPYDGTDYLVVIGEKTFSIRVLPGASMAVELDAERGVWHYRHELRTENRQLRTDNSRYAIFATREGLVGGTTANGHIIVPNDHFVALPSRRALSSNFGFERQVRLTYRGREVIAPVWDVGPWNTHDDYWNPAVIRETFKDLPRGKPESTAAFLEGYNGGLDERGRVVKNPAGIDLADGTFWIDLGLTNNDYVTVDYLWLDSEGPVVSDIVIQPGTFHAHVADASPLAAAEFFIDTPGNPGFGMPATIIGDVAAATLPPLQSGTTHTIFIRARDAYDNWSALASTTVTVEPVPPKRRAVRR
jgi:hypothetical protein